MDDLLGHWLRWDDRFFGDGVGQPVDDFYRPFREVKKVALTTPVLDQPAAPLPPLVADQVP
jgi:hypothetical protein